LREKIICTHFSFINHLNPSANYMYQLL
jgi:hypothetical protein